MGGVVTEFNCTCIINNKEHHYTTSNGVLMGNAYDQFSNYLELSGLDIDEAECLAIDKVDCHE